MEHNRSSITPSQLPLIIAGPSLQHTTNTDVTVWLALQKPAMVTLRVYETTNQGETIDRLVMTGERQTIKIGQYLHIVAVTAWTEQSLQPEQIYAYDLTFEFDNSENPPQTLQTALISSLISDISLSYFSHQLPTFVLPPKNINDLRIIHGSCRKPHGKGYDALAIVDRLITTEYNNPRLRPHQLFLTGDQIYGDDVADPLLWLIIKWNDLLLNCPENIPNPPPGQRTLIAEIEGGFTAGLHGKSKNAKSHLFSLGEYCLAYLLAWSDVLWYHSIPLGEIIYPDSAKLAIEWNRELLELRNFAHTLPKIRRILANIPVYSIFDDHDISDDWYLNLNWCNRTLSKPLGRRVIQNGLMAYSLFQAWGNTPQQFIEQEKGGKLLQTIEQWVASQGLDPHLQRLLERYLGIPTIDPQTNLPQMSQDDDVWVLKRDSLAIPWHYSLDFPQYQIIVLDTRTWRGYPVDRADISPPMLMSPTAFKTQLTDILQQTEKESAKITLIIAPTNLFGLKAIDWIQNFSLKRKQVFGHDVGDSWNMHNEALAQLLTTLFNDRHRLIILSGDIHYAGAVKLNFWTKDENKWQAHILAQLTASAIKNSEPLTQLIHTKFKSIIFPESDRWWVGWIIPPNLVEIALKKIDRYPSIEWIAQLKWIHRQPSQSASKTLDSSWIKPQVPKRSNFLICWVNLLKRSSLYLWWQEGHEIVGNNNIALVHFNISHTQNTLKDVVIQDVYWYWLDHQPNLVYSRFIVPLGEITKPIFKNQSSKDP